MPFSKRLHQREESQKYKNLGKVMRSWDDFLKTTPQKNATLQIRVTSDDLFEESINATKYRLLKVRSRQDLTHLMLPAELEGYQCQKKQPSHCYSSIAQAQPMILNMPYQLLQSRIFIVIAVTMHKQPQSIFYLSFFSKLLILDSVTYITQVSNILCKSSRIIFLIKLQQFNFAVAHEIRTSQAWR